MHYQAFELLVNLSTQRIKQFINFSRKINFSHKKKYTYQKKKKKISIFFDFYAHENINYSVWKFVNYSVLLENSIALHETKAVKEKERRRNRKDCTMDRDRGQMEFDREIDWNAKPPLAAARAFPLRYFITPTRRSGMREFWQDIPRLCPGYSQPASGNAAISR